MNGNAGGMIIESFTGFQRNRGEEISTPGIHRRYAVNARSNRGASQGIPDFSTRPHTSWPNPQTDSAPVIRRLQAEFDNVFAQEVWNWPLAEAAMASLDRDIINYQNHPELWRLLDFKANMLSRYAWNYDDVRAAINEATIQGHTLYRQAFMLAPDFAKPLLLGRVLDTVSDPHRPRSVTDFVRNLQEQYMTDIINLLRGEAMEFAWETE